MTPFIGQLLLVGFNWAPSGWLLCDGSTLAISQFPTLFTLIGTTYGGDGVNNFKLPDLRGRVPISSGQSTAGSTYVQGQTGGAENVTVTVPQYPKHNHVANASSNDANTASPANAILAKDTATAVYGANTTLSQVLSALTCTNSTGAGQPHNNLQPYLTVNWVIASEGIFPSPS
jgi:microcystin-dependent protein